jgi:mRNA-degrading endonuclease HigB of HigAB toxin-antitoxin module
MNIFYMAVYPENAGVIFNTNWMQDLPNMLSTLAPEDRKYAAVFRVYDVQGKNLRFISDVVSQEMICFFK